MNKERDFLRIWNTVVIIILVTLSSKCSGQQSETSTPLLVGDKAPPLKLDSFIRGDRSGEMIPGKIYLVDFWTTYCKPCLDAMPHLSKLTKRYGDSVSFISVNVYEKKLANKNNAKKIIDSLGKKVNFPVALDLSREMQNTWLAHSWNAGVPKTFLVDRNGNIAWVGKPFEVDYPLSLMVGKRWNIDSAAKISRSQYELFLLDDSVRDILHKFYRGESAASFYGEPDSVLKYVETIVAQSPSLKYTTNMVLYTFNALVKTDMKKAFLYAKQASNPSNPQGGQAWPIILVIKELSPHLSISPEIYLLGAQLMQEFIAGTPNNILKTAEWYWLGGDKQNAIKQNKAARRAMRRASSNGNGVFFE